MPAAELDGAAILAGEAGHAGGDRADLKTQPAMAAENLPRGRVDVERVRRLFGACLGSS